MAYATLPQIRDRWPDAPLDDDLLTEMLDAVHEQVVAYATTLEDGAAVPPNYVEGEVLQLRALGAAMIRDGDVLGFGDGFAVRVRPLGEDVKAMLRPRRAVPVIK